MSQKWEMQAGFDYLKVYNHPNNPSNKIFMFKPLKTFVQFLPYDIVNNYNKCFSVNESP